MAVESFVLCNPGTFYFSATSYDWTTPQNDALWRDEEKTLFDPCPAGWRVPLSGSAASGRSPWNEMGTDDWYYVQGQWSAESGGAEWLLAGSNVLWYAGAGCRYTIFGGDMTRVEVESDCWSTTRAGTNYFNFSAQPIRFYKSGTYHPAAAFSVRCVRE